MSADEITEDDPWFKSGQLLGDLHAENERLRERIEQLIKTDTARVLVLEYLLDLVERDPVHSLREDANLIRLAIEDPLAERADGSPEGGSQ